MAGDNVPRCSLAKVFRQHLKAIKLKIRQHEVCSIVGEPRRDTSANAVCGARNDDHFSVKLVHSAPCFPDLSVANTNLATGYHQEDNDGYVMLKTRDVWSSPVGGIE